MNRLFSGSAVLLLIASCGGAGSSTTIPVTTATGSSTTESATTVSPQSTPAELIGTWEIMMPEEAGPYELRVASVDPAPDGWLATGCLGGSQLLGFVPAAIQAAPGTPGAITIVTTIESGDSAAVAQLSGSLDLGGAGVADDAAGGDAAVVLGVGNTRTGWSASHVAATAVTCPPLDMTLTALSLHYELGPEVSLHHDPEVATGYRVETNIVASAAMVTLPGGVELRLEPDVKIFLPWVDFVTGFHFVSHQVGMPPAGAVYFVLLDALDRPIPGSEGTDAWSGSCELVAPRDPEVVMLDDGSLHLTWTASPLGEGFAPESGVGLYQVQVKAASGDIVSGSESLVAEHVLPWADFGGETPGNPTGTSYGSGLENLPDGTYTIHIGVYTRFSDPDGADDYCRIEDRDEGIAFTKADGVILLEG